MRMRVQSLASLSVLKIHCCRELWNKLAAAAPIGPLAWEPPCAVGAALRKKKKKKEKRKKVLEFLLWHSRISGTSAAPGHRFNPQPSIVNWSCWHICDIGCTAAWICLAWELHMPRGSQKKSRNKSLVIWSFEWKGTPYRPHTAITKNAKPGRHQLNEVHGPW